MHQNDNVSMNQNHQKRHSKMSIKNQNEDNQYRISDADKMTTEELIGAIRNKLEQVL